MPQKKEASFWEKRDGDILCELCPNYCTITDNHLGRCGVRKNIDGTLYSMNYARPISLHVDPVEKKPLYHFIPGTKTLSLGTVGCNLSCMHCQNWEISQMTSEEPEANKMDVPPEVVVQLAIDKGCDSIAYTYTEPTIFFEYAMDIARLAKEKGLKNILVTNGYTNPKPAKAFSELMDAANVDLKAFDKEFYYKICKSKYEPVLETMKIYKKSGLWLEVTNLIIAGENDNLEQIKKMSIWISENLGKDTPLHFSKAFPMHKMQNIVPTPDDMLIKARNIAKRYLDFVYIGNTRIEGSNDTACPKCGKILIKRDGYDTEVSLLSDSACGCGFSLSGIF